VTTRRYFLQTVASVPAILSLPSVGAVTADPSRLAMVIGNGTYRDVPLENPRNDALAMQELLGAAGFAVDFYLDTTRADMQAAIEKFGAAIRRPEVKQVVFYYAGHGVQLDWRNYLLPVDAKVDSADQVRKNCIDLGLVLNELGNAKNTARNNAKNNAKNKTFIVILDACRDNPFGAAYRPEQKGLAQFDAPVGSLLAYATSPGKGASDESASGKNGLYTEHLLRELAVRGTRIEDALKRVRLSVRLASQGTQIPWESTSLESDVYLFAETRKALSESELEKEVEAELARWNRIKSSSKLDDWADYVRTFPNGRFAEIAQAKVASMQAETKRQALVKAPVSASTPMVTPPAIAVARAPAIEIKPGSVMPTLLSSDNPYSAGTYLLGRVYTVGDETIYREFNLLTGKQENRVLRVTEVTGLVKLVDDPPPLDPNDRRYGAGRERITITTDLMGNVLAREVADLYLNNLIIKFAYDAPLQFAPEQLQVGKKWRAAAIIRRTVDGPYRNTGIETKSMQSFDIRVVRREKISVPAGTFDAFRLELTGVASDSAGSYTLERTHWLVPGLNPAIRSEGFVFSNGHPISHTRTELISLRQYASEI
jgi:Caspase domain